MSSGRVQKAIISTCFFFFLPVIASVGVWGWLEAWHRSHWIKAWKLE